jgi:thioesterase domain-containing protein
LGEIEAALLAVPEVVEAVVLARGEGGTEKRLVAYVALAAPNARLAGNLRRLLKRKLPPYMIPAAFIILDALPRHPNGKLDRQSLPAPGSERPDLEQPLVKPVDALEAKLAAIWRDILGLDSVGVQDDFFDLGGHSLQALRMVSAVTALTGRPLPLRMLYESPTIRGLAERLRQSEPPRQRSSLVAVQPNGSKPPIFLVHGMGGGMLWGYANLARHLGAGQPVYCFHSRALEGLEEFARVEDMAAQYVADLRAVQPNGPYYLGGYCFGGEVAFEMAQQLRAQGQVVELLLLFNAMPPNSAFEKAGLTVGFKFRFLANAWKWLRYFLRWPPQARRDFIRRKAAWLRKRLRQLRPAQRPSENQAAASPLEFSPDPEPHRRLWDTHLRASSQYQPRSYPGNVVVFRTPIYPFWCSFDPTFGWNEFVQGALTVKVISGAHESILDEPHVREVARALKDCLREVRTPRAGDHRSWLASAAPLAPSAAGLIE